MYKGQHVNTATTDTVEGHVANTTSKIGMWVIGLWSRDKQHLSPTRMQAMQVPNEDAPQRYAKTLFTLQLCPSTLMSA